MTDLKFLNDFFKELRLSDVDIYKNKRLIDGKFLYKPWDYNKYIFRQCSLNLHVIIASKSAAIESIMNMYESAQREFEEMGYNSTLKFSVYMDDMFFHSPVHNAIDFTLLCFGPEFNLFNWND